MDSPYSQKPYYHIGRASDLKGGDYYIYRALEILPGLLSWSTIIGAVLLSKYSPVVAAIFIIAFDVYWLLKTMYLSVHLRQNWKRLKYNMSLDWVEMMGNIKHDNISHLVIFPYYKEGLDVLEKAVKSLVDSKWDSKKMIVVISGEERAGEEARQVGEKIQRKYENHFLHFLHVTHPKDLPGEMPGKGSNISFAAEEARVKILDRNNISYKDVVVSAFDIDTVPYPQYFHCLTWHFLTEPDRYRSSFQPVPVYNNNIWDVPAISRVSAMSATFWQMIQQERPEKLSTFSSHAVAFQTLYEMGYWQRNMVSEDSRIFWNAIMAFDGHYKVVPISYPVSMDANLASSFWKTLKNIYKQQRRWSWGVENVPYILFGFIKNKKIPLTKKIGMGFVQVEGFWSLSTNPLIIFLLGWLPLILGGKAFNATVLSYNLPIITRDLMTLAMAGLVVSALISWRLLPPRPKGVTKWKTFSMVLQWILVPFTLIIFGAIPGIDSQTRLLLGKYMGFWVTPKYQKGNNG